MVNFLLIQIVSNIVPFKRNIFKSISHPMTQTNNLLTINNLTNLFLNSCDKLASVKKGLANFLLIQIVSNDVPFKRHIFKSISHSMTLTNDLLTIVASIFICPVGTVFHTITFLVDWYTFVVNFTKVFSRATFCKIKCVWLMK